MVTSWRRWWWRAGALAVAAVFLWPVLGMLAFSLRPAGLPPPRTLLEGLSLQTLAWDNYQRIFELVPLGAYTLNSLWLAALAVPLTIVTASWAGLALTWLAPPERRDLLALSVALLLIPGAAVWLARLVLFNSLGLRDTYWPLLAPALMGADPLYVLVFYWAFRQVPRELFEAARADGAHALDLWWRVALPLARPAALAVAALAFVFFWGDFVGPLLYLKSPALYTLPVGVQQLLALDRTNWPLLMAAAAVMTAPPLLFFLAAQHFFWREYTA